MRLIECYIDGFGMLSDRRVRFEPGLNSIKEDNGAGKTTLSVFIKVMLFGMEDTKKSRLADNDRRHYAPWSGGRFGGSLTIEAGGRRLRIERSFGRRASADSFALYDLDTGRPDNSYTERIGEELFGVDADGFERTVFLSERGLLPEEGAEALTSGLSAPTERELDGGDLERALAVLEKQRRYYLKKGGGGEIADTKSRLTDLKRRLDALEAVKEKRDTDGDSLGRLSGCIGELRQERAGLGEQGIGTQGFGGSGYAVRYDALKRSLSAEEAQLEELIRFFGGSIPTHDELDECTVKRAEAEGLSRLRERQSDPEREELEELFSGRATGEELKKCEDTVRAIRASEGGSVAGSEDARRLSERISAPTRISSAPSLLLFLLSMLAVVTNRLLVQFVQGYPLFLNAVLSVLGLSFLIVGLTLLPALRKGRREKKLLREANALICSLGLTRAKDIKEAGERLRAVVRVAEAAEEERDRLLSEVYELIGRFPAAPDAVTMAEELIAKHRRLVELRSAEVTPDGERCRRLLSEVEDFLSRFATVSQDPITEIRRALGRYEYLRDSIANKNAELKDFARFHSLDAEERRQRETEARRADIDAKITRLEREYAVTEQSYKAGCTALEEGEEIKHSIMLESARLERLERELATVQKTAELLTEARERMATRHLGKMRESFEGYRRELAASELAFSLDTSFSLSVTEGGATHSLEAYSRGTRELYRLITRLSLIDSLFTREQPFLILDDPFISLDDGKIKRAGELLKRLSADRQIIYLTCSGSRDIRSV